MIMDQLALGYKKYFDYIEMRKLGQRAIIPFRRYIFHRTSYFF